MATLSDTRTGTGRYARIVGALAVKDIVDSLSNKTTLILTVSVLLMVLLYRWLPHITADPGMYIFVYDAGQSRVVQGIADSDQLNLVEYEDSASMRNRLSRWDLPALGLELPANLDDQSNPLHITGYVPYWLSPDEVAGVKQQAEDEIEFWTGQEVIVELEGNVVYTAVDQGGRSIPAAIALIYAITLLGLGVIPNLMLEEKLTKTMDALLVSPASPTQIVLGKALAGLVYGVIGSTLVIVLNREVILQWSWIPLVIVVSSLFAISLGLPLGLLVETRQQLQLATWLLIIPLMLGFFFGLEVELLPDWLGSAAGLIPTNALSRLLQYAFQPALPSAWPGDLLYLCSWIVVLTLLSIWLVRRQDR